MFPINGIEAIPLRKVLDMPHLKTSGIYCIVSPSGKKYIGQSVNIQRRIRSYLYSNCPCQKALYGSLRKHGSEEHKFCVLEFCKPEELNNTEAYYIRLYGTQNELNLTDGGKNFHHSIESRKAQSEKKKGGIAKNKGVKYSKEVRERMAKGKLGLTIHQNSLNALREASQKAKAGAAKAQSKEVVLIKDVNIFEFPSRQDAAIFLGVYREKIFRSYRDRKNINGYKIIL